MPNLKVYQGWALITGASAGIGREFARAIAARGVSCVLVARRADRLEELAVELRDQHGVECRCVEQDLTAPSAVDRVVEAVADIPIGILVNNAGLGHAGRFESRDPARLAAMVQLNCAAPVLLTRAFIPAMVERKRGAVIMVSSVLGIVTCPYESVYAATKAFDLHLGEALYSEYRGSGIDVITLCPQATKTEFLTAQGFTQEESDARHRMANRPEDIVELTLRKLGKKPTTGPFLMTAADTIIRFLPRKLRAILARPMMAKIHLGE
ncbi:MAG: short-chain dehydrogenase [Candidatus Hydrogenedentota bacterium]